VEFENRNSTGISKKHGTCIPNLHELISDSFAGNAYSIFPRQVYEREICKAPANPGKIGVSGPLGGQRVTL
jgi:hypothetical protein